MLFAKYIAGPQSGQGFSVKVGKKVILGRDHTADISIPEITVSRKHMEIFWIDDNCWIRDLSSRNGTFLNGVRIEEEQKLNNQDRIQIAELVEFTVSMGSSVGELADSSFKSVFRYDSEEGLNVSEFSTDSSGQMLRDLNTLYQVGNLIAAEQKKQPLLIRIGEIVFKVINPDRIFIFLKISDSDELEEIPLVNDSDYKTQNLIPSSTIINKCLAEGVSIISDDAQADTRFDEGASIIASSIRGVMCVPIESMDKVLGVLYVDSVLKTDVFSDRDLVLLSAIGKQAGVAVERAVLSERLENLLLDTVQTLVATIEAKDVYTRGHSERVTYFASKIAQGLGLSEEDIMDLKISGLLHDIGKIGVPESVLLKPGKLTKEEFEKIKAHPSIGADIVKNISGTERIEEAIRHHHERFDGKGYPTGLAGQDIPFFSRIIAVADSYDAMTLDRAYRSALSREEAKEEILVNSGTQFDPNIANTLLRWLDSNREQPNPSNVHTLIELNQNQEDK